MAPPMGQLDASSLRFVIFRPSLMSCPLLPKLFNGLALVLAAPSTTMPSLSKEQTSEILEFKISFSSVWYRNLKDVQGT